MELSQKIQKMRKELGLTQEQLAEQLFVSRTAVSKWETGRGTPSMESLQMMAKFFGITLDELLRADEVIVIAEDENRENINRFASCVDGIFNIAAVMGLLLPLYKVEQNQIFHSVPLYQYNGWLAVVYWTLTVGMTVCGAIQILINKGEREKVKTIMTRIGMAWNISAVFLLILSGQPYPAVMFFALFLIKGAVMAIRQK